MVEATLLPHQFEVLSDTETKVMALVGGYGNGKTYTACRKAIHLASLNKGFTGIVTEPTYPMIRDIFVPEMKQALEEWGIPYNYNGSSNIFTLHLGSKPSTIICMSAENYERLVGINAAFVIMDEFDTSKEEVALNAFNKLLGRLRAGNVRQIIIFTTPEGFKATYKLFVKENDGTRKIIKARTQDNPYLPVDFIDTLRAQYPPHLLSAYLEGEFINLTSGSVYSYFKRDIHHIDAEIEEGETLHIGQDFNIGGCCSTVNVIRGGVPMMLDEFSSHDTQSIIETLKSKYSGHHIIIYPDASGNANKTNASKSDIGLLRDAGYSINAPAMNGRVEDRVNAYNIKLSNNEFRINTNKCPRSTEALEQQVYDKNGVPEKFGGAATIDDWNDAQGYFIVRKFGITTNRVTLTQTRRV